MKKLYALFSAQVGAGERTLYVCPITPEEFKQRFGDGKDFLGTQTIFMLGESEWQNAHQAPYAIEWKVADFKYDYLTPEGEFPYFTRTERQTQVAP